MYEIVLWLHNHLRWLVFVVALLVFVRYLSRYIQGHTFSVLDDRIGSFYMASLHLQLLLGLSLYLFLSPMTAIILAIGLPEGWMKISALRFHILEHPVAMILGIVIAQIGRSRTRRATSDKKKFANSLLFFFISLVVILSRIPWGK